MDEKEISKKLENMEKPEIELKEHKDMLKMTLVNTKKSALWGTLLIVIPSLFLFVVFLKEFLGVGIFFDPLDSFLSDPSKRPARNIIEPILFIGGALATFVINMLAITHFNFTNGKSDFLISITVRKKMFNIILIAISFAIICILILFAVTEGIHHAKMK